MSWGISNDTPTKFLQLHLFLADELSARSWVRSQIWSGRISAHAWSPAPGLELVFDITFVDDMLTAMLVVRNPEWISNITSSLTKEEVPFTTMSRYPNRVTLFQLQLAPGNGISKLASQAASKMLSIRASIDSSLRQERRWQDNLTGIQIPFTVKPERKGNRAVIFMFTSIRNKQHWIDFEGPFGSAIQTNRARVVFLLDEFSAHYSYHLGIGGDTSILGATIRFIENYVIEQGYAWQDVALAGMSKGGTSALAVGSQLPQCEVYVVAPQLALGSYLQENRPQILRTVTGRTTPDAATRADELLWDAIESSRPDAGITRCMLFTSEHDPHCTEGLSRLEQALDIGERFELLVDRSEHTGSHLKTVRFHAPALLFAIGMFGIRAASGPRQDF